MGGSSTKNNITTDAHPNAAGVVLVTFHPKHGHCMLMFKEKSDEWGHPGGLFEIDKHANGAECAAAELFEETCGLVKTDELTLRQLPHERLDRKCVYDWYGLEVDPWWLKQPYKGLKNSFKRNLDAVKKLKDLPDMDRFLEMKEAAYVTLDSYRNLLDHHSEDITAIVRGKVTKITLRMHPTQARLNLAHCAFAAKKLKCNIVSAPVDDVSGTKMDGMTTAVVSY